MRRIGITMRVLRTPHGERHDALAQGWGKFLAAALPGIPWMPLPNLQQDTLAAVDAFALNGLLFTGGDDWDAVPERDATERLLLELARRRRLPVLGVCRGAQILNLLHGGHLTRLSAENHVAVHHGIRWQQRELEVNSYHNWGITPENLSPRMLPLATAPDETIEAFRHGTLPWFGILWHPEREPEPMAHDLALVRELFADSTS